RNFSGRRKAAPSGASVMNAGCATLPSRSATRRPPLPSSPRWNHAAIILPRSCASTSPGLLRSTAADSALQSRNQPLRYGIHAIRCRALQQRLDALRDALAEFHAELVEGIDVPDHALREHLVLVHCQQRAEMEG